MSNRINELETDIEDDYVEYAINFWDVLALKVKVPGRRNWPDRINLLGNGYVFYIEFKKEGKEPRPAQIYRFKKLRERGYHVYVCDNLECAKDALHKELRYFFTNIYHG